ncbi:iron-sulfur protein, partial [Streptomyces sp. T21Q-yed]|nr:iron-sulfur protein [Streptomyces sp. T21Q-yed]
MSVPPIALADAYTRLTEVFPGLDITQPSTDEQLPSRGGWITAASLADGGTGLDAFLAWDDAQVLRDYGQPARPDVVAGFGLHRYAWPVCLLITVPWFLLRRVPRFPVTQVSYDRTAPGLALGRLAARPTTFACLPGDP